MERNAIFILTQFSFRWLGRLGVFFLWLTHFAVGADSPIEPGPSLPTLLKSALVNSGQIKESEGDIEIARAQLAQARAALFPHGSVMVLAAPMPGAHGDAVNGGTYWHEWGPFVDASAQIVLPLYTFGQVGNYKKAAERQIDARTNQAEMKKAEVIAQAKEFYYGYLMAVELGSLVDDLTKFLDEAVTTAEKQSKDKKKKGATVKPHDIFRLKTALQDLRQKKLQADAGRMTAEKAVAWVTGANFQHLTEGSLEPEEYELKSLDEYLKIAEQHRPEFKALSAGQEARAALRDAKRAQSYPVVFLGAFGNFPWTPVRDRQNSPFAYDPYNQITGGAGLGLKLDIEFWRHAAEAAEQNAELMKLKATETYAAPGVRLQVRKAFWELQQAVEGMKIAEERKSLGERWFVSNAMGWSIGITPPKDLLEALEGNGLARKNYIETVYALNLALAHLTQAVGQEVTSLKY